MVEKWSLHQELAGAKSAHFEDIVNMHKTAHPPTLHLGELGEYKIVRVHTADIAHVQGLMGIAMAEQSPQTVFIKSIMAPHKDETTGIDRDAFFREMAIYDLFSGSRVRASQIYGVGINDQHEAIAVMEYLQGPTLDVLIQEKYARNRKEYNREMALLFLSIAQQLSFAQSEFGLVHRDIKPSNIIVTNGLPVIADWGIAYHAGDDFTRYHRNYGSTGYSSAEQCNGEIPTEANDIFSLGVVVLEAFGNIQVNFRTILPDAMAAYAKTSALASEYPKVAEVVARATAAQSTDRYTSMQEFMSALRYCFADFLTTGELENPDVYLTPVFAERENTVVDIPTQPLKHMHEAMSPTQKLLRAYVPAADESEYVLRQLEN